MHLGRKEFDAFKTEVTSFLDTLEKNQEGMLNILKEMILEQTNLKQEISTVEEDVKRLEGLIADNEACNRSVANALLRLIKETDNLKRSSNSNMKQISESINALMLEGLLDRAELLCTIPEKPVTKPKKSSSKKEKNDYSRVCPLCGSLVLNDDSACNHCGHIF